MNNQNKNNNHWKTSAAEFRGFVKGTLIAIKEKQKEHKKELCIVKADVVKIKEYIAGNKAVGKIKTTIFGALGGTLVMIVFLIISYFVFK